MKYCANCGQELADEAVFCANCGNAVAPAPAQQAEKSGSLTGAIICAFLLPIVGLIMGIIANSKYTDPAMKNKAKGVIYLSIGMWIVYFVIFTAMGQL